MNARWFRLQSVLDLRASALEEAQNSLSLALAGLGAAQNDCDQARCEAAAIADASARPPPPNPPPNCTRPASPTSARPATHRRFTSGFKNARPPCKSAGCKS